MDRLSRLAIEDVEEAVLARLGHRLHPPAANLHVEEDRRRARIVVPHVVVRLLEVPLQPAGIERQRDDRIGEEIDPRALRAVAERIADGHVEHAELRIDRRGFPDAAAVALAADPRRSRNVPALILSSWGIVLKCHSTFPVFASTASTWPPGMWLSLRVLPMYRTPL